MPKEKLLSAKSQCTDEVVPIPHSLEYGGPLVSRGFHNCIMFAQEVLINYKSPRVLIVGFLSGFDLVYLLNSNIEAYGLELFIPDVEIIKNNSVRASATHMPFKDKSFDWVLCTEVFEHLPIETCYQVLDEFKRVSNNYYLTIATRDDGPWETHINVHKGEYWIKKLRDYGLGIEHAELSQRIRIHVRTADGLRIILKKYPDGVLVYGNC